MTRSAIKYQNVEMAGRIRHHSGEPWLRARPIQKKLCQHNHGRVTMPAALPLDLGTTYEAAVVLMVVPNSDAGAQRRRLGLDAWWRLSVETKRPFASNESSVPHFA